MAITAAAAFVSLLLTLARRSETEVMAPGIGTAVLKTPADSAPTLIPGTPLLPQPFPHIYDDPSPTHRYPAISSIYARNTCLQGALREPAALCACLPLQEALCAHPSIHLQIVECQPGEPPWHPAR
jgi:hypothetical protein